MIIAGSSDEETTSNESTDSVVTENKDLSSATQALEPIVASETKKADISKYEPIILGIIEVESRGALPDPMQSSESAGLSPGTLISAKESIHQGVTYFSSLLKTAESKKCDIWTVVQSYNFGGSYIDYISKHGGTTTTELADQYSKTVVAPSLGNTAGITYAYPNPVAIPYNGGSLYRDGGNFFYDLLVKQYVLEDTSGKRTDKESNTDSEWDGKEASGGTDNGQIVLAAPSDYEDKLKYPKYNGKTYSGGEGYPRGQCTWYVYNRMAQLGMKVDGYMGNGGEWDEKGKALGYTVSDEPHVGWAVSFPGGVAGSSPQYGHVAFVEAVNSDGSILVSEGNVVSLTTASWRVIPKETVEQASFIKGK